MGRNIVITPNRSSTGSTQQPNISFSGLSAGTISLLVEDDGSLVYDGVNGSLFSISDNKDGLLHSVNDVSGLPIFQVWDDNRVILGVFNNPALTISASTAFVGPTATTASILHISGGSITYRDGNQGANKVLVSDANGVASWQTLSSTAFTGGTVTGATNFTNGLTANTISATTITGSGSGLINIPISGVTNLQSNLNNKFDKSGGTVTGSVLITGDVTILGTATTINTQTLTVKDNIITINSNYSGNTAPYPATSGIEVLRGSATTATLLWDEPTQKWIAGVTGNTRQILFSGDSLSLLSSGHTHPISEIINLQNSLDNKFDKSGGTVTGNIIITGNTNISGTTTVIGDLNAFSLVSTQSIGDEGGEIRLSTAQTNNNLSGGSVTIDIYQNRLRFFESGSPNRGAYIDLSATTNGVGTNLLTGGSGEVNTASNLGSGTGIFAQKSGVDLEFKSLTSTGGTVTITSGSTTVNLEVIAASNFTGGTVTGPTNFTNGLTANTISATTYYNLPTDIYVTGATYDNNTFTFTNNTGGTFNTLFNTVTGLTVNGNVSISGSSLPNGYALSLTGDTNFFGDVYVSGDITYNGNLLVTGGTIIQSGLTASTIYTDYIDFNTGYTGNVVEGRLQWDDGNGTLVLGLKGGLSDIEIGLENMALCFNDEPTTLTAGTVVYVSGSQGNRPKIKRAIATGDGYSVTTLGMVSEPIASGAEGFVTTFGMVNNLNTDGLTGGTAIWLSPFVAGEYTIVKPQAPNHTVLIGYVVRVDNNVGSVFIHISNGWEIDELHDVRLNGRTQGDLLSLSGYNGSNVWVNTKTLNGSYTITGNTTIGGNLTASTVSATTYYNLPLDIRVTGASYNNNTFTFTNNTGGTFNTLFNTLTGLTVNGILTVTGNTSVRGLTGTSATISGSGQNILTVVGSGSTSPLFSVIGSSGELFSITDSLTGSLFSVNDISGLPILEVFSDNTTLMGNYLAPSLNTTARVTLTAGTNTVYSIPTSAYTGAFYDYTLISTGTTGARAGNIMAIWSGTTAQYSETSTNDIGNTAGVTFSVAVSGNNAVLSSSATTAGWTLKTIIRSI